MLDIKLRLEQPTDYHETEIVMREAFWNHFSPGCDEHYLIHIMRNSPAFIPELDFVALLDEKIVGNVVYVKSIIKSDNGKEYEVLSLGPISVLPEYQGKGVGKRLIECSRKSAVEMGFRAILLMGDPDYYLRRGFFSAEQFGIRTADNMFAAALHVCGLYENALSCIKGRYIEAPIFEIDNSAAAEFDKQFPIKEKISGSPSQVKFERIVAMRKMCEE